jgi:predicted  nucleic acid-binding Zn-ribbon protein
LVEEEISKMKAEKEALEKSHEEKVVEYEAKLEEVNAALTKSTEQMTKMKRQFQAKLKALREKGSDTTSPTQSDVRIMRLIELQSLTVTLMNN